MRRMILGSLLAATLGLPAAALAAPNARSTDKLPRPPVSSSTSISTEGSNGTGAHGGNEPGHVTGPGNAPIDNESRGPINDVQPGNGSADTRQSKNPKPVR
jgi:hypothetical protein